MPVDQVSLLIGGKSHSNWESYKITSDFLIPADCWEVSLGNTGQSLPASVAPGAAVQVQIDGVTILSGQVDEIEDSVSVGTHGITMAGRDLGAVLTDSSAPIFTSRNVGLEDVVRNVVMALGITKVSVQASSTSIFNKITVEPGETAWEILQRVAEANGLWPWFAPDGSLIIGGADYGVSVSADLILKFSGQGNNIENIVRRRNVAGRYSSVTVLGQSHGTEINEGQNAIMAQATDANMSINRPFILIDAEADTRDIAMKKARKVLTDGRLNGFDLEIMVYGHRIGLDKPLWTPGQRVHVVSEPHRIDAVFFLMGRTFERSLSAGTVTWLRFKEDGVWTIDAIPEAKKASGNSLDIVDFSS